MKKNSYTVLIQQAVASARISSNGWWRATCPVCPTNVGKDDKRQSLSFKPENGYYRCLRCGTWGWLEGDHREFEERIPEGFKELNEANEPPEGYMPLYEEPALSAMVTQDARDYLLGRKIPVSTWESVGIGVCLEGNYKNRIIIPVETSEHSHWVGWVSRTWEKSDLPYRYPPGMRRGEIMFNQDALWVETTEPLAIVEGCFDALPHYPDAAACLGKPSHDQFSMLLSAKRPIVMALDGDAWEESWMWARRLQIRNRQASYIRLEPKQDPNDLQPGELKLRAQEAIA